MPSIPQGPIRSFREPQVLTRVSLALLQVSEERWYQALVRVVESLAAMGRQLKTRMTDGGEKDDLWATVAFAYEQSDK
jgi:hypothetical protein